LLVIDKRYTATNKMSSLIKSSETASIVIPVMKRLMLTNNASCNILLKWNHMGNII